MPVDPENPDQLAALRAELDQAIALAPEIARTVRGSFDAYLAEGFSTSQALYLVAVQHLSPGFKPE